MSGKSINLNQVRPIPISNAPYVMSNNSIERSEISQRNNDLLVAKSMLSKLYHKKFAHSVEENNTVALEESKNSSIQNQTENSSIKSQAMNILADLYRKKHNVSGIGRWRRSSISQNTPIKSNFDEGSSISPGKASLYSYNKRNRENNSLSRPCDKISTTTRYVHRKFLTY